MNVSATGMPVARTNSRSAGVAPERTTPLPASATGLDGAADDVGRLEQLARLGLGPRGAPARQRPGVDLGLHDVLGQLDVGRAGLLALGDLERLAHHLGDDVGVVQARVPLGDGRHHAHQVDVLVRLLVHALQVALAGERHQRRAVQVGVGHRGGQVQRAGAERAQAHAGVAGQAAVGVGHVAAALLVADGDEVDRRARERLVQVQGLLTRDAEDVLDPLGLQALHEHVRRLALGHAAEPTRATWPRPAATIWSSSGAGRPVW